MLNSIFQLQTIKTLGKLFSPLGKLADRAIYFACINLFIFLVIARQTIISGSTGLIFTTFSPNDRHLYVDDRSGYFLWLLKGLAMATNFGEKFGYMDSFDRAAFQNGLQYHYSNLKMFNGNILSTSCGCLMKIGQVTPEITRVTSAPFWIRRQKSAYLTKFQLLDRSSPAFQHW